MEDNGILAAQLLWGAETVKEDDDKIKIRLADSRDLEPVVSARIALLREIYEIPETEKFPKEFVDAAAEFFMAGDQVTAIAEDKGTLVGTATLCYISLLPAISRPNGRCAYLANVYTLPEYRNQKIATRLIESLVEEARNRGVSEIICEDTERVGTLYSRLGFTESRGCMYKSLCSD